jgi:DNA-binding transcriptional ArsR family regulator
MPAVERLPALALNGYVSDERAQVLKDVAARQSWNKSDLAELQAISEKKHGKKKTSKGKLTDALELWSRPGETGEGLLASLQVYQEVFFVQEEKRILPALQEALAQAQTLAEELPLAILLEELSQGLRFDELEMEELILAPSFWATPLMIFMPLSGEREMYVFGGRPADTSLVPGEVVPDALFQALKALADPTRLRILHYLSAEPLTQAELARRLRLRPPTVTHHLHTLRLAPLVQLTFGQDGRRYAARREAIMAACDMLQDFLNVAEEEAPGQSPAQPGEGAAL